MTFDPSEFFRLANELALNVDNEPSLRTAIGRAYYSVLLQAREHLGIPGRRNIHGRVIGGLRAVDRTAGDQLEKLEMLRGEADYELLVQDPFHRNWRSNWTAALSYAAYISGKLQGLRRPPSPT